MYKCQYCNIKLPTPKLLEIHTTKLHGQDYDNSLENVVKVQVKEENTSSISVKKTPSSCEQTMSSDDLVKEEKKTSELQCTFCQFKARNKNDLMIHENTTCKSKLAKKRMNVDEMAELFNIPLELLEDAICEYPTELKHNFTCEKCGYVSSKQGVNRHRLRSHSGPANIHCNYCPKKFRRTWELNTHMKFHFNKYGKIKKKMVTSLGDGESRAEVKGEFDCDICKFSLTKASALEKHKVG